MLQEDCTNTAFDGHDPVRVYIWACVVTNYVLLCTIVWESDHYYWFLGTRTSNLQVWRETKPIQFTDVHIRSYIGNLMLRKGI